MFLFDANFSSFGIDDVPYKYDFTQEECFSWHFLFESWVRWCVIQVWPAHGGEFDAFYSRYGIDVLSSKYDFTLENVVIDTFCSVVWVEDVVNLDICDLFMAIF